MKALSASVLAFTVLVSLSKLSAQSQPASSSPLSDSDRAIVQSWSEEASQIREARIEGDRLILPTDDRNAICAFLRVYRVKRITPGSDSTRPAGYTTCVGASRFSMKSSAKPQEEGAPTQNVRSK